MCKEHGPQFHLTFDRAITGDLWSNAMLKDGFIARLPTDSVGMIYESVDLFDEATVRDWLTSWLAEDLPIGKL